MVAKTSDRKMKEDQMGMLRYLEQIVEWRR
jgi:hypothetical protein